MSRYVETTIEQFREVLKVEKGWTETQVGNEKEVVFEYRLTSYPHIVIRVWSSIRLATGIGRGKGLDAIRVCAVNTATDRGYIRAGRVYRTQGWRDNLKVRVLQVIEDAKNRLNSEKRLNLGRSQA